jgi:nicotinamide mononucleotide transporter
MDFFATAFSLWGSPTTWLEIVAFILSLAMVGFNIRELHWGWPLAAISSLMYFALFWRSRLYGDASLQIFFALIALWGWWQWLRGARSGASDSGEGNAGLHVVRLSRTGILWTICTSALLWPITGYFLKSYTDTDVPWWDAFPTALSVVGQYLLGRKYIENWLMWIVVNVASVALFAYKGLWLTVILYTLFIGLSVAGWRAWQRRLPPVLPSLRLPRRSRSFP